jgi:glycosyltransferase involved in cell wall biosynthesis
LIGPIVEAIDLQALQVAPIATGSIGKYVASYTLAMKRAGRLACALLAPELPNPANLPGELVDCGAVRWDSRAEAREILRSHGRMVYHVAAPFLHVDANDRSSLEVNEHWAATGIPRVVTVYDLAPLRPTGETPLSGEEAERFWVRASWLAGADLVLAVSDYVRSEAIDVLGVDPNKVATIGMGLSPYYTPPDGTGELLWEFHLGRLGGAPYVLTVLEDDACDSLEPVLAAVSQLAASEVDLRLVVVGVRAPASCRRIEEAAVRQGVDGRLLVVADSVNPELRRACYRHAAVTVMASGAGWSGLPLLESAACGTPALAPSGTAVAEATATLLAQYDADDDGALSAAIAAAVTNRARRSEILAAQEDLVSRSTWISVSERAAAALDRLGETLPAWGWMPLSLPRRVALVGPLPPHGGGIGSYNLRLIAPLSENTNVDVVSASPTDATLPPSASFVRADSFGSDVRPASFDALVYTLGNSSGHLATVQLALRYPGWLWLHETRLPATASTSLAHLGDDEFEAQMRRLLERAYPGRAPLAAARNAGRSHLELLDAGVGLVGPLAERATGILVNSQAAKNYLYLDLPPNVHHPAVHVLPAGCPPVRRRDPSTDRKDPLVVAFGTVSFTKRPDIVVDVAASVGCRLAFVGPCPELLALMIKERAEIRNILESVEVIDTVTEGDWWSWMDRASVALQLRDFSNGEMSAAVLDALAAGTPVLTNLASASDYPEGTVSLVDDLDAPRVAERLDALLRSPGDRAALSHAGQAFAAANQMSGLAAALLDVLFS